MIETPQSIIRWILLFSLMGCMILTQGEAVSREAGKMRITMNTRWLCYYSDDRGVLDVAGYDLLILDTEALGYLTKDDKAGRICLGYLNLGEADTFRWFWPDIADKQWVLKANPDWPDARLIDVASDEWADLVVEQLAKEIMAAGYDGFFLDCVDTPEGLFSDQPARRARGIQAMVGLIERLRSTYPNAIIVQNSGFEVVEKTGQYIDAFLFEGTISTWRMAKNKKIHYSRRTKEELDWLKPRLDKVRKSGIPILALEYVDPGNPSEMTSVKEAASANGDSPFLAQKDLSGFATPEPGVILPKPNQGNPR